MGFVMMPIWPFEYVAVVDECRLMVMPSLDESRPPTLDGPNVLLVEEMLDGLRSGAFRCSLE